MSLYELPKEMLIKIIEKTERPTLFLKMRTLRCNKHDNNYIKFIGPFYSEEEIGEYFKSTFNLTSFNVNYFKKHQEHIQSGFIYELDKLSF